VVPGFAFHPNQNKTGQKTGNKRYTQIDKDALCNLTNGYLRYCIVYRKAKPSGKNRYEK
jgi:hypothetical protein